MFGQKEEPTICVLSENANLTTNVPGSTEAANYDPNANMASEYVIQLNSNANDIFNGNAEVVLTTMPPLKLGSSNEQFNSSFRSTGSSAGQSSRSGGRCLRRSSFTKERRNSLDSQRSRLSSLNKALEEAAGDTEDDDSVFSTGSEDSLDVTERRMSSVSQINISKSDMQELQELFESSDVP